MKHVPSRRCGTVLLALASVCGSANAAIDCTGLAAVTTAAESFVPPLMRA